MITIGSLTFENDAFADSVSLANGAPFDTSFDGLIGSSNQSFANIGTSNNSPDIEVHFDDNAAVNGEGADIFIYVPGEVFAVEASLTADFLPASSMQAGTPDPESEVFFDDAPLNPFFFNPNSILLALDLDDLGVAEGEKVFSIFLRRGDIEGAIYGVGAANSVTIGPNDPTPGDNVLTGTVGKDTIDALAGNDVVKGLAGNDRLIGNGGRDVLNGGEGADSLFGGNGKDEINGGKQGDFASGGQGDDRMSGNGGGDTLNGNAGADSLFGGDGKDEINGGKQGDFASGGEGGDMVSGNGGADTLNGNAGADSLFGGDGNDEINGGKQGDFASGGKGGDTISGNGGADTLNGGTGEDRIFGGAGKDLINGGLGRDVLTGGAAADRFVFTKLTNGERDVIRDFQNGLDKFDVSGAPVFTKQQKGDNLLVTLDNEHEILILNLDATDFGNNDFV